MITHIIVWIEIEHIIHLLLFGYPIIIILIKFEERAVVPEDDVENGFPDADYLPHALYLFTVLHCSRLFEPR